MDVLVATSTARPSGNFRTRGFVSPGYPRFTLSAALNLQFYGPYGLYTKLVLFSHFSK